MFFFIRAQFNSGAFNCIQILIICPQLRKKRNGCCSLHIKIGMFSYIIKREVGKFLTLGAGNQQQQKKEQTNEKLYIFLRKKKKKETQTIENFSLNLYPIIQVYFNRFSNTGFNQELFLSYIAQQIGLFKHFPNTEHLKEISPITEKAWPNCK